KRGGRRAEKPHGGEERAVETAEGDGENRRGDDPREGGLGPDQVVELPRRHHTTEDRDDTRARKGGRHIGPGVGFPVAPAAADKLARSNQDDAEEDRRRDPRGRRQKAVLDSVLHEEYAGERERDGRDDEDPVGLDPVAERRDARERRRGGRQVRP